MLVAIHDFIYVLSSGALQGFPKHQRSHFTPVIPARGLPRQENCYNLKASLGYLVRPCLNQPKRTTKTIIVFNRCFMIWHPIYATKLVFLSQPQSCKHPLQRSSPKDRLRTSSHTSLKGSPDNSVLGLCRCKCERRAQGYFSWDAKKMGQETSRRKTIG